jgi:hypothetical protein
MESDQRYWFPAKRYGWGWGLPVAWQGWLVMACFGALLIAGIVMWTPNHYPLQFVVFVVVLNVALIGVCWLKGEPPRWRWGDDRE